MFHGPTRGTPDPLTPEEERILAAVVRAERARFRAAQTPFGEQIFAAESLCALVGPDPDAAPLAGDHRRSLSRANCFT
ncbi:MAG: hypothetical protein QM811_01995 [Pirellulales bacterium]